MHRAAWAWLWRRNISNAAGTGTVRGTQKTKLHELGAVYGAHLCVESVDINERDQVRSLSARLYGESFDLLWVNAGVKNDDRETIADVSTEAFVRIMMTNALSPMRVVEALQHLVPRGRLL